MSDGGGNSRFPTNISISSMITIQDFIVCLRVYLL